MSDSPIGPTPPTGTGKPRLSTPLVVLFSFLLLCLPILPIYLWRKGRLPAVAGIGLAIVWVGLYATAGLLAPEQPATPASSQPAATESPKPTPKPTAVKTKKPTPAAKTTAPAPAPTPTATKAKPVAKPKPCADIATNVLKNPAYVFKCQFGKKWPLTVTHGIVGCRDKSGTNVQILTFLDPKGKEWALNGIASGAGYPRIDPIWRDDGFGAKVDIGPLIDRAFKVCD